MARNLAEASSEEIRQFLNSFDNILFDCDGVILLGEELIPGAKDTIECMRSKGKEMKLITNNCFRTIKEWDHIFNTLEFDFTSDDVTFPTKAVIDYLKTKQCNKKVFVLAHPAMSKQLKMSGIDVYDYKYKGRMEDLSEVPDNVKDDLSVGAVVVDLDFDLTYMKLMKAGMILKRPDVHFIFCATDKYAPIGPNLKVIGSKFIGEALETISGRKPIILGKPSPLYNNYLQKQYNFNPARTLFVGDSLITDMLFATRSGFKKLLVLTGTTSFEDMKACPKEFAPKYYLKSLGDLYKLLN